MHSLALGVLVQDRPQALFLSGSAARCAASFVLLWLAGCSTLPSGRGWGADATYAPGWQRVGDAARDAASDPWVWGPLLGAAVFQIDSWDRRTSDWARERTPVFGSQRNAERWSDDLRQASAIAHYATLLAAPSGETPREWTWNKAKGALVHAAAVGAVNEITLQGKDLSKRERPNGLALESFPSGHTSSAAVHTRLASRTLAMMDLSSGTRRTFDIGLHALTLGTSWSRIEAGWHYPSDTLVAMAVGNFVGALFNDAFMGSSHAGVQVRATEDGALLWLSASFE
jgi:membrane-associated phospholipid phosphatase